MCNLFTLAQPVDSITGTFDEIEVPDIPTPARYSIRPGEPVATILHDGRPKLTFTQWGLVPSWAKDPTIGQRLTNARSETLKEKPSFKGAFKHHRCLIVADGFYEFHAIPGQPWRQPVYFRMQSKKPFAFAGLWEHWQSDNGSELITSTIITTVPNQLVQSVHHRMPVILPRSAYETWLNPTIDRAEELEPLLAPFASDVMECFDVSPRIDRSSIDNCSCIEPIPSSNSQQLGLFGED